MHLYLGGLGFRSIGRFLNVSHVSVFNWIKEFGEKLDTLRSPAGIEVIEIDEMHTYFRSKKTTVGSGLLLIEVEKGSQVAPTHPIVWTQFYRIFEPYPKLILNHAKKRIHGPKRPTISNKRQ